MKRCPACETFKPLDDFPRNRSRRDGRQAYCKPCWNARIRMHKEERYGGEKSFLLRIRYGVTGGQVEAIMAAQNGLCAICGIKPAEHVDHCHETGIVRGLLCFGCNRGLGKASDDAALLRRGLSYLEAHGWHGQLQLW